MTRFLWICAGGAAGTGARYLVALWAGQRFGTAFPYGTLIVNVAGCFLMAAVINASVWLGWSATLRAALTVGVLGGFTTYSSFNFESMRLLDEGSPGLATLNLTLTLVLGVLAGWAGLLASRVLFGR